MRSDSRIHTIRYCDKPDCSCGTPSPYVWFAKLNAPPTGRVANQRDVIRMGIRDGEPDPDSMFQPQCNVHWNQFRNGKPLYGPHPAFAVWIGNGTRWHLCKEALDHWLDNADDDPGLEPRELIFL